MPNLPFVTSWIMRARIVLRYIPAFATAKPAFHRTIALTSFAPLTLPQIRFRANWSLEYNNHSCVHTIIKLVRINAPYKLTTNNPLSVDSKIKQKSQNVYFEDF